MFKHKRTETIEEIFLMQNQQQVCTVTALSDKKDVIACIVQSREVRITETTEN